MKSTFKFIVIILLLSLIACEKGIQKKEVTLDEIYGGIDSAGEEK